MTEPELDVPFSGGFPPKIYYKNLGLKFRGEEFPRFTVSIDESKFHWELFVVGADTGNVYKFVESFQDSLVDLPVFIYEGLADEGAPSPTITVVDGLDGFPPPTAAPGPPGLPETPQEV